jgi:hypothetical protein
VFNKYETSMGTMEDKMAVDSKKNTQSGKLRDALAEPLPILIANSDAPLQQRREV